MNVESVAEFLGGVPLLQRLPISSLRKIAQLVKIKNYERGEFVIREGKCDGGIYFIWEGEAEVCGHGEEEIQPEYQLKRYDYFGNGALTSEQQPDVIALSKLMCLVLPPEHCALLRTSVPVENILHMDPIEVNLFQGITLPDAPKSENFYGGQFMGQALAAATKTVDCLKILHHFQAYFLHVGDYNIPIMYRVYHVHDGKSFASRRVDAIQKGNVVFTLLASFQREEKGFEHQETVMPLVPSADTLISVDELCERRIIDPRLPRAYRNKVATSEYVPWPIEIRFCDPSSFINQTKSPPRLRYWLRAKGKLSDDQALHRCVVAYASDLVLIGVTANPHRKRDLKINVLSLNHTMWFHRDVTADDWLLFVVESPSAHGGRGICKGQMFNQKGELMVTVAQEGLLRAARTPTTAIRAKY